jgi:hypothetical protein
MTRAEPEPLRDWSTKAGAEVLAERVRRCWADRGYPDVEIWVEALRGGREPLVTVKSRLTGGLPPSSPISGKALTPA